MIAGGSRHQGIACDADHKRPCRLCRYGRRQLLVGAPPGHADRHAGQRAERNSRLRVDIDRPVEVVQVRAEPVGLKGAVRADRDRCDELARSVGDLAVDLDRLAAPAIDDAAADSSVGVDRSLPDFDGRERRSAEPFESSRAREQEVMRAFAPDDEPLESSVELPRRVTRPLNHERCIHRPVVGEVNPVVGTDLRSAPARDRHEDAVRQSRRCLGVGARGQQDGDVARLRIGLRPRGPEGGGDEGGPNAALRRPERAREEVLAFPAAARRGAPVDGGGGVRLDDMEAATDEDGRRSGWEGTGWKALLRDRASAGSHASVERHKAQEGLSRGPLNGVRDRGSVMGIECQSCRTEAAARCNPRDARDATAAGEGDPPTLPVLGEHAHDPVRPFAYPDPREYHVGPR